MSCHGHNLTNIQYRSAKHFWFKNFIAFQGPSQENCDLYCLAASWHPLVLLLGNMAWLANFYILNTLQISLIPNYPMTFHKNKCTLKYCTLIFIFNCIIFKHQQYIKKTIILCKRIIRTMKILSFKKKFFFRCLKKVCLIQYHIFSQTRYNTQNLNLSNSWPCFTLLNFIALIFGISVP